LIDTTTSIHIILLNEDEWESSSCSCAWWQKNKCYHTVSDKPEQEEFVGVDFDMVEPTVVEPNPPIKSKRGRKKK